MKEGRLFRHPTKNNREIYVPYSPASRHHKTVQMAIDAIAAREKRSALLVYLELADLQAKSSRPSVAIISGETLADLCHVMNVASDGLEYCQDCAGNNDCGNCGTCTQDPDHNENMDCAEMRHHNAIYAKIAPQLTLPAHLARKEAAV